MFRQFLSKWKVFCLSIFLRKEHKRFEDVGSIKFSTFPSSTLESKNRSLSVFSEKESLAVISRGNTAPPHTNTPKLSNVEPGLYLDGWHLWNSMCCKLGLVVWVMTRNCYSESRISIPVGFFIFTKGRNGLGNDMNSPLLTHS